MNGLMPLQLLLLTLVTSWVLFWLIALCCFGPRTVAQLLGEGWMSLWQGLGKLLRD